MDPVAERIALNETLFRDVNENISGIAEEGRHEEPHFVCECGERSCNEKIALAPDAYASVRANPLLFIVKPGHEIPAAERVVERHERYVVVEKPPEARPLVQN